MKRGNVMKKKISVLLVIAMCLTLCVPAFAIEQYDPYNINVIDDSSDVRIVQTSDEHYLLRHGLHFW